MANEHGFNEPGRYHGLFRHFSGYYERFLDLIIDAGDIDPGFVLDLACGVGDFTSVLARRFPRARVTGMDVSPAFITFARTNSPDRDIAYHVSPAQSLPGLSWAGEIDTIFIKGAYHLFEQLMPIETFAHPAFRALRWVIVVEKTERSLASYPVPEDAARKRQRYVSADLGARRLRVPPGVTLRSLSYGESIVVPGEDYLDAVRHRQFSYLDETPDAALAAWLAAQPPGESIALFEENVSNIYQL